MKSSEILKVHGINPSEVVHLYMRFDYLIILYTHPIPGY